jgi:hypothetical protein
MNRSPEESNCKCDCHSRPKNTRSALIRRVQVAKERGEISPGLAADVVQELRSDETPTVNAEKASGLPTQRVVNAAGTAAYDIPQYINVPHVHEWQQAPDSDLALCACGDYSDDWYCPQSPDHVCHYDAKGDFDQCDYCGQPEERK